jgi:Tfp pilus assembly protein PilF
METAVKNANPGKPQVLPSFGTILLAICFALGGCATHTPEPEAPQSRRVPAIPQEQPVRAVDRLLQESRDQLAVRDWQAAIASAERGLRIDRRQAELYLLLAEGYRGLGNYDRSVQFARQGLRHADQGSAIASALQGLIATLEIH